MDFQQWVLMLNASEEDISAISDNYSHSQELTRIISPQLRRTGFSTIPSIVNGTNAWTSLGQEFGFYKPRDLKFQIGGVNERRENIFKAIRKVAPSWMDDYFTPKKKTDRRLKDKYTIDGRKYNKEEMENLYRSLALFDKEKTK